MIRNTLPPLASNDLLDAVITIYWVRLIANHYRVRFEPNKDVISIIQDLYESGIPSPWFSHVASEHSLHPVGIVRLDAGPATKANMLN